MSQVLNRHTSLPKAPPQFAGDVQQQQQQQYIIVEAPSNANNAQAAQAVRVSSQHSAAQNQAFAQPPTRAGFQQAVPAMPISIPPPATGSQQYGALPEDTSKDAPDANAQGTDRRRYEYMMLAIQDLIQKVRVLTDELRESTELNKTLIEERDALAKWGKEQAQRASDVARAEIEHLQNALRLKEEEVLLLQERLAQQSSQQQQRPQSELGALSRRNAARLHDEQSENSPIREIQQHRDAQLALAEALAYQKQIMRSPSEFSSPPRVPSSASNHFVITSGGGGISQADYARGDASGTNKYESQRGEGLKAGQVFGGAPGAQVQPQNANQNSYDDWKNAFKVFKPVNKIDPEMAAKYARSSIAASKKHSRKVSKIV